MYAIRSYYEDWIHRIELLLRDRFEEEHIQFKLQLQSSQKEIPADEKLLSQVLINILKNAMEAMQDAPVREIIIKTRDAEGKMQLSRNNFV